MNHEERIISLYLRLADVYEQVVGNDRLRLAVLCQP